MKLSKILGILLTALILLPKQGFSQFVETEREEYPHLLPIWGDKVYQRGMDMPLPIGFSVGYVSSTMGMGISDLGIEFNPIEYKTGENGEHLKDDNGNKIPKPYFGQNIDQGVINNVVDGPILDILNETPTLATAQGWNYRLDVFLLPFLNVYGMIADMKGTTTIGLGSTGSTVDFTALAYGGGATLAYGTQNGWFGTVDMNYSLSSTELIDDLIPVSNYSIRVGKRFKINKGKQKFAVYLGAMNRNFSNDNASPGQLSFEELLGSLEPGDPNKEPIKFEDIYPDDREAPNWEELSPAQRRLIAKLLTDNREEIRDLVDKTIGDKLNNTMVDYSIKKDLLQTWTVQCGFSLDLNKHFSIRGEYGIAEHNKFLMTGINYRFGF